MMKWASVAVVVVVVLVGAYFIMGQNKQGSAPQPSAATPTAPETQNQAPSTPPKTGVSISPAATNQPQENTVTLTSGGFSPATLTVSAGTKVTWVNKSGQPATVNSDPHPIHTNYPPLNLGRFPDSGVLTLTFDKPGTYGFHNHLNPTEHGTIMVQ